MADLISRVAAIAEISRVAAIAKIDEYIEEYSDLEPETGYHNLKWCAMEEAKDVLSMLPAVDAVPVVHGRWIHLDPRERATISGKCSCCGWEAHYYEDDVADMPYCPNCGAKMDGEAHG